MRAKSIFGMLLLAVCAFTTSARAENQAAKIPHNVFWGYWDSGFFDPRSAGVATGDAFHVTICGPIGELLKLDDMDKDTLQKLVSHLTPEGKIILLMSSLASTHPWYSTILSNQKYGGYFLIAIEPVGEGYEHRQFVWPNGLTLGLVTKTPADTIAAVYVYTGTDFKYRTVKGKDVDTDCTLVSLVGDKTQTATNMPFDDLVCKRGGIRMVRGILAVPRHPAGFPTGWTWTKENITSVVWLWNGRPIAQTIARQ